MLRAGIRHHVVEMLVHPFQFLPSAKFGQHLSAGSIFNLLGITQTLM